MCSIPQLESRPLVWRRKEQPRRLKANTVHSGKYLHGLFIFTLFETETFMLCLRQDTVDML